MFGKFLKAASQKLGTVASARNFSETAVNSFRQSPPAESFLKSGGTNVYAEFNNQILPIKGNVAMARDNPFRDQREYFQGALKVIHSGEKVSQQHTGAALPAAPSNGPALSYAPYREREWMPTVDTSAPGEPKGKRRAERQIMGEPAADVLERAGLGHQRNAPWAHIQPDHTIADAALREDQRLRKPTFQGANQTHSAFEMAAKATAREIDGLRVRTRVGEPIGGESQLPSGVHITFQLKSKDGSQELQLSHFQNSFVHDGARFGDPKAIKAFVEHHKELLDNGSLSAETHDNSSPYMCIKRLQDTVADAQNTPSDNKTADFSAQLDDRNDRSDRFSR
ncbi:MAG: hypothetical protein AAFR71_10470 [Pseudomonadota bacterium]